MKHTLTKEDFMDWMRQAPYNPFSYGALEILWEYLSDIEEDCGVEIDFDPVAFRCDFSESSVKDILLENRVEFEENLSDKEKLYFALAFLNKKTTIVGITEQGTVVYQNF
jgi:hypothetical protein